MTAKIIFVSAFLILTSTTAFGQRNFNITNRGAGGVQLGMTVAQARRVLPKCNFKRSSDGDGAILISVTCNKKPVFTLASPEDEDETRINEKAKIDFIEVWDPRFSTAAGVRKGMRLSEVETRLGKVREIILSEIESREFVTFQRSTKGIVYRTYGGIYSGDRSLTRRYKRGSAIWSISVGLL